MITSVSNVKKTTSSSNKPAAVTPLSAEEVRKMHAYWRAANYLSVGQINLMDNPLLKEPLQLKHVKPPFDMVVLNDLDRFHLIMDVIDLVPQLGARADRFIARVREIGGNVLVFFQRPHHPDDRRPLEWPRTCRGKSVLLPPGERERAGLRARELRPADHLALELRQ